MSINQEGIELLKQFEGFRSKAYKDIVGVWTIGYGFIKGVKEGDVLSREDAEIRLKEELEEYVAGVKSVCKVEPNENQLAAMVVFAFNVGVAGFKKSTVIKAHNRGDFQAASRAFALWNKAGGKVVAGLTRRRNAEAALYLKPIETVAEDEVEMPQKVDEEKPMAKSGIISASTITAGTSTIAIISESTRTLNEAKGNAKSLLGDSFPIVALALVVVGCGYVIYTRFKQRENGWV
jgi:lysozyme